MKFLSVLLAFFVLLSLTRPAHSDDTQPPTKKIALLFLTIDDLNHSKLWYDYLKNHLDKFNIYFHSKYPPKHFFFCHFRIAKICPTSWGKTCLAERELLREAVNNPENFKFVLLSESCVPLVDPKTLYNRLTSDEYSYLSWGNPWWEPTHGRELTALPKEHRKVNQQWFSLNRYHAEVCAYDETVTEIIESFPISNEDYPASLLSFYNSLDKISNVFVTFVDWTRSDGARPYSFDYFNAYDAQLLQKAQADGYLFARKFTPRFSDAFLYKLIQTK